MPKVIAVLAVVGCLALAGCAAADHSEASCAGPGLDAEPRNVPLNHSFRVRGEGFAVGCDGTGALRRVPSDDDILLGLRQGERTWKLSKTVADGDYAFGLELELPYGVAPGPAVVTASGANGTAEARLLVREREPGGWARAYVPGESASAPGDLPTHRPPRSTLSFGARTVRGSLGTYCWPMVCADAAFPVDGSGDLIPPDTETLVVPTGSEMVFDLIGEAPSSVTATAYPLDQGEGPAHDTEGNGGMPQGERLRVERTSGQTCISADLPPGAYLVDVFVQVVQGDASYSYNVSVERGGRR